MSASLTMSRVERENSSTGVPLLHELPGEDDFLTDQRRELEDSFENSTGVVLVQTSTNGPHISFFRRNRITILVVVILLLLLISTVLAVLFARKSSRDRKPEQIERKYCLSEGCINKASYMIKAMDRQANPCKDFFQFSCGGWQKNHRIPESEAFWGVYSAVWQKNQALMKALIHDLDPIKTKSTAVQKAKIYYDACMNLTEVNRIGKKPLQDIIAHLGGWNITAKPGKTFSFAVEGAQVLKKIQKDYGVGVFFDTFVETDDKNSSRNIILVDQGGLGISWSHYKKNNSAKDLAAYLDYMTNVGVLLGGEEQSTREKMKAVIQFESQLAKIFVPPTNRSQIDEKYNKMTLTELKKLCPKIPWQILFDYMFDGIASITDSEGIVVYATPYLKKLSGVINRTSDEVLNTYMVWQVANRFAPLLSSDFRTEKEKLGKVLDGTNKAEDLWKKCISSTDRSIGMALGSLFIKETFKGASKEMATEMVDAIRAAFKSSLPSLSWMDDKTRAAARDKADAVVDMIGYPAYVTKTEELDKKYEELKFAPNQYFNNFRSASKFSKKKNLQSLRKPVDKQKWFMTPPTVNAYYSPSRNQIVFPAGILQQPYYDSGFPQVSNFGGIGAAVGHELVHGFDNSGRMYDKTGNFGVQWWTKESVEAFQKKADCMVKQYSKYSYYGVHVNGKFTLGENIADNGGLKAAYVAYKNWVKKNGDEMPMPALNLTIDQTFFLSYGQSWCANIRAKRAKTLVDLDPHSPNKFRVLGALSNFKEFADAFNCPVGSPMNPEKKCVIW